MAEQQRYNGWTNYETWVVNLWMDNEQPSHEYWRAAAQEAWEESEPTTVFTKEESARYWLADRMKEEHEDACPDSPGLWGDLLGAALSEVDWAEIAQSWIDEHVDKGFS